MMEFRQEDYILPESSEGAVEKHEKGEVTERTLEQLEAEIQQGIVFFENIDILSHKDEFLGEIMYTNKTKEIAENINGADINKIFKYKKYYLSIENLIKYHEKALSAVARKEETHKPGEQPTSAELMDKSDEISYRKGVLERHLHDLRNYIKEETVENVENIDFGNPRIDNPKILDMIGEIEYCTEAGEQKKELIKKWKEGAKQQYLEALKDYQKLNYQGLIYGKGGYDRFVIREGEVFLKQGEPDPNDPRLKQALEFGMRTEEQ